MISSLNLESSFYSYSSLSRWFVYIIDFISFFIEAHDALHHFSCKMLTPRHCSGSCSYKSPLLPPWTTFPHVYFVWTSTSTHPPKHRWGGCSWDCWRVHWGTKTCIYLCYWVMSDLPSTSRLRWHLICWTHTINNIICGNVQWHCMYHSYWLLFNYYLFRGQFWPVSSLLVIV